MPFDCDFGTFASRSLAPRRPKFQVQEEEIPMYRNHMIACVAIAAIVALVLYGLGAPAGVFAFVIVCPVMMIAMMFLMANAMRTHDHAPKH